MSSRSRRRGRQTKIKEISGVREKHKKTDKKVRKALKKERNRRKC